MTDFMKHITDPVTKQEMCQVYEKIKTPHKIGPVVKWEDDFTDSPTVFKQGESFYMYFIAVSKDCSISGYETHLAKSDDLIHWEYIGPIFKRNDEDHWDSKQCAGYAAFPDVNFEGTNMLQKINGSYYISYLAGNSDGYEPDPLYMGLAKSIDPIDPNSFQRFSKPILRPDDPDVRQFETKTLYKSFLFYDEAKVTGYPYVNVYNAKDEAGCERIFLAVSDDAEHWQRYGDRPVVDLISGTQDGRICGDPQIIKIDDIYVMLFFRYQTGKPAYNTFACSRNLVDWTVWNGEPLIKSEYPWENVHAHKTWFVRHNGCNYHFYCAVNSENERFIAMAKSEIKEVNGTFGNVLDIVDHLKSS